MIHSYFASLLSISALTLLLTLGASAQPSQLRLADLKAGTSVAGFTVEATYLGDAGEVIGCRLLHEKTGFIFDYLGMQTIPQTFIWVNSFPTSDMGEPHTQEHLLLGKGNRGRYASNMEAMLLTSSSAFTSQWRTCYHAQTAAGADAFYQSFRQSLDALLHPDYSDEEIRREVCNFGVAVNSDGTLRLEEKGTVYNEMVSSFERSWSRMSRALDTMLYGPEHPLAYVSGGLPAAIRRMKPEDIRKFHANNYHLDNMGMVGVFPKEMALEDLLSRIDRTLNELQPEGRAGKGGIHAMKDLPSPRPAEPVGTIRIAEYPNANASQSGPVLFAWPATLSLTEEEQHLLSMFLNNVAGDATTEFYKIFVDARSRRLATGATNAFAWVSGDQGHPVYFGLSNVDPAWMTPERLKEIRSIVVDELARIAKLPDGSPELRAFNTRMQSRIVEMRRSMQQFVNTPPGFGFRGAGSGWMDHLDMLARVGGTTRSVTLKPQLDKTEKMLSDGKNIWRELVDRSNLIRTYPYASAARPSPALVEREEKERSGRIAGEVARLKGLYGTTDDNATLQRFSSDYDATSHSLDSIAALVRTPRFVENPPMSVDDALDFEVTQAGKGVPYVVSRFDGMTSGTVGIALKLNDVADSQLRYLSILPTLITESGVIDGGRPISYEEMSERLRNEILSLSAYTSSNPDAGRYELVVKGEGNDLAESRRAVEWMRRILYHPDWRVENLPRIRDIVDQALKSHRTRMQGSEEGWVNDPEAAFRRQDDKLYLSIGSFLTRTYNLLQIRWELMELPKKERPVVAAYIGQLSEGATSSREDLKNLTAALLAEEKKARPSLPAKFGALVTAFDKLSPNGQRVVREAARDLNASLTDIPDGSLALDWRGLCRMMRDGVTGDPMQTLARIDALRESLLRSNRTRMFGIGSGSTMRDLLGMVNDLASGLTSSPGAPSTLRRAIGGGGVVNQRVQQRLAATSGSASPAELPHPLYVGLVNPSTGSGVFMNSAPTTRYNDISRDGLLDFLTVMLYSGHGSHGLFMKTWGAGLAYSNGTSASPRSGRLRYYAERCPALPQTISFVINELKSSHPDSTLIEYAVAQVFAESRGASTYEDRGEAMAADLADGVTPDVVARFRRAVLDLRSKENLVSELDRRKDRVYGSVLPGYAPGSTDVPGGCYYVIGPEKQLGLYEEYLKGSVGPKSQLIRIYPRDYWMESPDGGKNSP